MKVEIRREKAALGECQEVGKWTFIAPDRLRIWVAPGGHFRDMSVPAGFSTWLRDRQAAIPEDYRMLCEELPEDLEKSVSASVSEARQKFAKDCEPDVGHPWDDHGTV